jgi:dihydropteroate synthase
MSKNVDRSSVPVWRCGKYLIPLDEPCIMAIINLTADSFSGDGVGNSQDLAIRKAERAISEGAGILDIGAESSRPGAMTVSVQEELDKVIPVVEALVTLGKPVSIDTLKPEVMRAAIAAGANIINDINALQSNGAVEAVKDSEAGICLMHMQGEPASMQQAPRYENVVDEVESHLTRRLAALRTAGVDPARVVLDPGFGFGKTLTHNIELFRSLERFLGLGRPLLIGVSRKSMLGLITGREVADRTSASIVAAVMAIQNGASIVRVHDVAETRDAIKVWQALSQESPHV